jgi:cobalt-zinc-cadmium efflux system membrane fusion protein
MKFANPSRSAARRGGAWHGRLLQSGGPGCWARAAFLLAAGACSHPRPPALQEPLAAAAEGRVELSQKQIDRAQLQHEVAQQVDLSEPVVTSGRITFDDLQVSHIFSPVSGRVVRIDGTLGASVAKGATLATIDSPDLGQFSADFNKARADYVAAQHDTVRQKSLFDSHAIAQRDYEASVDTFRRAQAEFARAGQKAALLRQGAGSLDEVSQFYQLRTAIAGKIIARSLNPGMEIVGQYGGGSAALELFTIGSLRSVWLLSDLFEMDMQRVAVGQSVQVKVVAYPDETFVGRVDWVSPSVDPTTRTAKVRCVIANPDEKLKPEMFATVSLAGKQERLISLPRSSIFRLGTQTVVFVMAPGSQAGRYQFERRTVQVDEAVEGNRVPVRDGVKVGESVVTAGGILLLEII